jgi:hypothetical protein
MDSDSEILASSVERDLAGRLFGDADIVCAGVGRGDVSGEARLGPGVTGQRRGWGEDERDRDQKG